MTLTRQQFLRGALGAGALATAGPGLAAETDFPQRPLKLVVPFAAGGATDILGRLLASSLADRLGQPVVVENRPGAGTMVAASQVAKSPPDGYTLFLASNSTLTLNPAIRAALPYDPLASFAMLGGVADMGLLVVAHPDARVKTLADLVRRAKAEPGQLSYASFGAGSSVHVGAELLQSALGIRMTHVPFNGSSQSLTALMGGQVPVAVDTVVASAPLVRAGRVRAVAALSAQRLPLLPEVPTVAESGYPGFEATAWYGLLAPAGLPAPVERKLALALQAVMARPEVQGKLREVGLTPRWSTGQAQRERVEQVLPHIRPVGARGQIKAD